jgi:hypothetical protein
MMRKHRLQRCEYRERPIPIRVPGRYCRFRLRLEDSLVNGHYGGGIVNAKGQDYYQRDADMYTKAQGTSPVATRAHAVAMLGNLAAHRRGTQSGIDEQEGRFLGHFDPARIINRDHTMLS